MDDFDVAFCVNMLEIATLMDFVFCFKCETILVRLLRDIHFFLFKSFGALLISDRLVIAF